MNNEDISFNRVAVFIDAENLVIATENADLPLDLKTIIERIREEGQIIFIRAYADWSQPLVSCYVPEFRENTVEMMWLSTSSRGKNTADIHLAVDALEMTLLPSSPDMIVIISGDRDFVPLVQKIKRYGKSVMGIGVEGSTSDDLVNSCNIFLYADDILVETDSVIGKADVEHSHLESYRQQTTQANRLSSKGNVISKQDEDLQHDSPVNHRLRRVFSLLARAVDINARQGLPLLGSSVSNKMLQINPAFYPSRFGFSSFKDFAIAAQQAGYVKVIIREEGDILFDADFKPANQPLYISKEEQEADFLSGYDFENPNNGCRAYRDILRKFKHLDILPWVERQKLVTIAWEICEKEKDGVAIEDLVVELQTRAYYEGLGSNPRAVELLVRTMCIAQCFSSQQGAVAFENKTLKVKPCVETSEALDIMNYTYLTGIRLAIKNTPLVTEAVALFLFDKQDEESLNQAKALIKKIDGSDEEESAIAEAFRKAEEKADRQE